MPQIESPSPLSLVRYVRPGDRQALDALRQAADELRRGNNHLAAAYAMDQATQGAWGDPDEMRACARAAFKDYRQAYDSPERCSITALVALLLAGQAYYSHDHLFQNAEVDGRRAAGELRGELAQRLVACFQTSPDRDSYLVRGFVVETNMLDTFVSQFVPYEAPWGTYFISGETLQIPVPSAFTLFRYLGDYRLAQKVIELCPDAFTTPGLRGWQMAVRGLLDPSCACESFAAAADAFAEDRAPQTAEEAKRRGPTWDNMNVSTWAPHFRVRSLLAAAVREPSRVREFIASAAQVADPEAGGRAVPTVRRLALLVRALGDLLLDESIVDVEKIQGEFVFAARLDGATDGDVAVRFIRLAAEAFRGFSENPSEEIATGRLHDCIDALRRLPFLEVGLSDAVAPAIRERATHLLHGPVRTWMHRTLETIKNERDLRHIVYRLSQASLPLYAQILHGPLEYGKDVVALFERDGERVLRMYQAKLGDLSLPAWREARPQLEEMFQVELPEFVVPRGPELQREGILVFNGHANPHAFPAIQGWVDEQERVFGRTVVLMNIDAVVRWVVDDRLVNEFREALRDVGIEPGP